MIGPVQLMMIGYNHTQMAGPLRAKVNDLKADPAVRIVDVLCVHKNRDGTIETEQVSDLIPEDSHEPGEVIDTLLTRADAARTMNQSPSTGAGYLYRGDLIPDFRQAMPSESGVLAILLEHRWSIPLRDVATEEGVYAVADGWMGRDALKNVELIPQDS
jgi:hypothetical protein